MKKFILSLLAVSFFTASSIFAQETLEASKLGDWNKPAATKIANVDAYIDMCGQMYQEAIDIRKQYQAIDTLTLNVGEVAEIANNQGAVIKEKLEEYKALLQRVQAQQETVVKLPAMAEAAAKAVPVGLKAISATKAIASTKNAMQLIISENAALLKAITQQITSLSTAPVTE